jgi:hypothetical protein
MSTIKSSDEHLTLNADGSSKDIKFQANGVEKASISSAGAFTSTTIDATKLTGALPAISGAALTGVGVAGISSSADATAITIDSSENVGVGKASALGATLHIDPAANVTTSYGSPLVKVGGDNSWAGNGSIYSIGFGYTNGATVKAPVEVGMVTTSASGVTNGSFVVATRDGTTDAAPAKKLEITNDGRGLSQFTGKAWINFDGTGTIATRDSHNVSSIADSGTGNYQVNLTNAMASTNFCVTSSNNDWNATAAAYPATTSQIQIWVENGNANADTSIIEALVFGD